MKEAQSYGGQSCVDHRSVYDTHSFIVRAIRELTGTLALRSNSVTNIYNYELTRTLALRSISVTNININS